MKKTKEQKGITLVALIITVIVLIILAMVTINAVSDGGIIGYAKNAVEKHRGQFYEYYDWGLGYVGEYRNGAVQSETSILDYYSKYIENDGKALKCEILYNSHEITMQVYYIGEGKDNETYTTRYWVDVYNEWIPYTMWEDNSSSYKYTTFFPAILGETYKIEVIRDSDGVMVAQNEIKIEEYDSIFKCQLDDNTKTAAIVGIKEKNIQTTSSDNVVAIVDDNGNEITTLEIPSIITKGNEKYTVTKIGTDLSGQYNLSLFPNMLYGKINNGITTLKIPSTIESFGSDNGFMSTSPDKTFVGFNSLTNVTGLSENISDLEILDSFYGGASNSAYVKNEVTICPWLREQFNTDENGFVTFGNGEILVNIELEELLTSSSVVNATINVPNGVETIYHSALSNIDTGTINIPNSVQKICSGALSNSIRTSSYEYR